MEVATHPTAGRTWAPRQCQLRFQAPAFADHGHATGPSGKNTPACDAEPTAAAPSEPSTRITRWARNLRLSMNFAVLYPSMANSLHIWHLRYVMLACSPNAWHHQTEQPHQKQRAVGESSAPYSRQSCKLLHEMRHYATESEGE